MTFQKEVKYWIKCNYNNCVVCTNPFVSEYAARVWALSNGWEVSFAGGVPFHYCPSHNRKPKEAIEIFYVCENHTLGDIVRATKMEPILLFPDCKPCRTTGMGYLNRIKATLENDCVISWEFSK